MTGSAAIFSMLIVGLLFIGHVNSSSNVPLVSYLLVPLAPLSLWLGTLRPVVRLSNKQYAALLLPLSLAPILLAVTLALVAELGAAEY